MTDAQPIPSVGLRIFGDVHGKYKTHAKLCLKAEKEGFCTVQLGDYGFSYGTLKHYNLSPDFHKIVGGNHDNYDVIGDCPNNLGDFGEATLGGVTFFFVRGAYSVDQSLRTQGRDWWPEEELSYLQCQEALDAYQEIKPEIVITHDCPSEITEEMGSTLIRTRTGELLQQMFDQHKPQQWFFGHYHKDWKCIVKGTQFQCLPELHQVDILLGTKE